MLLRGIPVNPGGGLVPEPPRPGGGGGIAEDGAGAEAFSGKEDLKPEKETQCELLLLPQQLILKVMCKALGMMCHSKLRIYWKWRKERS